MAHMITVETYGSQRVRAPASGAMVSAYKIGYTTIGKQVLLALYGIPEQHLRSQVHECHSGA